MSISKVDRAGTIFVTASNDPINVKRTDGCTIPSYGIRGYCMQIGKINATSAFCLTLTVVLRLFALNPHEPKDDYISVQLEQYFTPQADTTQLHGTTQFQNIWMYAGLPGFRVFKKNIFTAIEYDAVFRNLYLGENRLNAGPMQRFGLFAGISLIEKEQQTGSFMFGTGVATDFAAIGKDALYMHLIYDHRFTISDRLVFGLGILFSYNLGAWKKPVPVNLLPTLRWRPLERTYIKIAWDNLEFRQFITERIAGIADVRYDLSFFRLKNHAGYSFETVGAGAGLDIWIIKNLYMRIRYKEILYKNEKITTTTAEFEEQHQTVGCGRSVRLMIVYAK